MKKMILLIGALGGFGLGLTAQTNQTYRTDMQRSNIYANERTGNTITTDYSGVRLNTGTNNQEDPDNNPADMLSMSSMDQFQGYSTAISQDNTRLQLPVYQQGLNSEVQQNIQRNTYLMSTGAALNDGDDMSAGVSMNAMEQFRGNRTSGAGSAKQKTTRTNSSGMNMNSMNQYQGNRNSNGMLNSSQGADNRMDMGNNRAVPYDTSKNNGHCLGCGSGTLTDKHPWIK